MRLVGAPVNSSGATGYEVGYIPFGQDAANLFFQLVSTRYEHASMILSSNLPFSRWGDVFSDHVIAAAMIDRIVHHADVLTLKGNSYRLRNTDIDTLPSHRASDKAQQPQPPWPTFRRALLARISRSVDRTTARAGEHTNCQGRHQGDRAKPRLHRENQKQTLATRQRVRGTSPSPSRSTMDVSRNLSRALRVPPGWPSAPLDRTRPTPARQPVTGTARQTDHIGVAVSRPSHRLVIRSRTQHLPRIADGP
jgi:IstB-like ATP binding protein